MDKFPHLRQCKRTSSAEPAQQKITDGKERQACAAPHDQREESHQGLRNGITDAWIETTKENAYQRIAEGACGKDDPYFAQG